MPIVVKDRVRESTTTAGTGTVTLLGAVTGFQAFSVIGNGNETYYAIVDTNTGQWEVGSGTYSTTGPTLSRDAVLDSSSGGVLVNFAANSKDVFCNFPALLAGWSDYRLKSQVAPVENPFERLGGLSPVSWNWSNGEASAGFLAHELQESYPQAVFGAKDGENQYGTPVHQIVDLSPVVADLTRAVMLLKQELDTLRQAGSSSVDRY